MATGFDRRSQTQSPFSTGVDLGQKTGLQGNVAVPGVSRPAGMNVQPVDTSIMDGLAQWGGKAIAEQAAKQMNKSLLDGQMAQQQGAAFSTIETGGDKWKIEGYHQMEAQTLSAQLLAAQQAEIQNTDYAMSPDEYRQQFSNRADAMLDGKDPRVQELVRRQMATQIPTLAAQHTSANAQYSVQRTFEAGVQAIHAVSQDSSGDPALMNIADPGPNSPLAALGPNERRDAVTQGVMFAFQNDNPAAFIKLKASGMLDQLTPAQQAQIESSRQEYQQRVRGKLDEKRMAAFDDFQTKLDTPGAFKTPMDAVDAGKKLYSTFGLEMNNEEGWKVMTAARTGIGVGQQATMNNIETAVISNDYGAAAMMAAPAIVANESGGDYSAHGPKMPNGDYAVGKYQVMASNIPSWTKQYVGRAMTPEEFRADKDAQDAVFKGRFGGYIEKAVKGGKSSADAVRDAISTWHSGRPYDQAVADGATDGYMTTKAYTDKAFTALSGMSAGQADLTSSEYNLSAAQVNAYGALAPTREQLDQKFMDGNMSEADWRTQRTQLMMDYHVQRTAGDISQETSMVMAKHNSDQQAAAVAAKAAGVVATNVNESAAADEVAAAQAKMLNVVNNPDATFAQRTAALTDFATTRDQIFANHKIQTTGSERSAQHAVVQTLWDKAVATEHDNSEKMAVVNRAAAGGSLGTDKSVDPKTRDKWFKDMVGKAQTNAQRIAATVPSGMRNSIDLNGMVQSEVMTNLAKSGYVPEAMKAQYSAVLNGNLLDKNGNPTQEAVSAVSDYMVLKGVNPSMANMLLDDKAQVMANLIVSGAGNNVNGIASAIYNQQNATPIVPGAGMSATELAGHPALVSAVTSATERYFQENPKDGNDQYALNRGVFTDEVKRVAAEDYSKVGGKGDPTAIVANAVEKVAARTAFIGGIPILGKAGIDIGAETFGPGLANFNGDKGLKEEMMMDKNAVNDALQLYIAHHAGDVALGIPSDIGLPWDARPTTANSIGQYAALPFIGLAKYTSSGLGTLGNLVEKLPGMANPLGDTGAKNFTVEPFGQPEQRAGGTFLPVTVIDADGIAHAVVIPLKDAGREYIKFRQTTQ